MHVKTEMKRKLGREPEGGSKKRKEVGNESPLLSMFQKQQTTTDLQKTRESYNAILEKRKQLGLEEGSHAEPVRVTTDVTPDCLSRVCLRLAT